VASMSIVQISVECIVVIPDTLWLLQIGAKPIGVIFLSNWSAMNDCFICGQKTDKSIAGKTHTPPIGPYEIPLCDTCKPMMGDYREKLRAEVIRQVTEHA